MIVWRKSTGPMIGMSESTGIGDAVERSGELNTAAFGESTFE